MNAISDTVMTLAVVALFADGHHPDPQRRPHPPQGDRPHRRPGHRAAQARGRRSTSTPTAWSSSRLPRTLQPAADRHLRRPPHGHVVRPGRPEGGRGHDPRPRLRRQDLSRLLGRPGSAPESKRRALTSGHPPRSCADCHLFNASGPARIASRNVIFLKNLWRRFCKPGWFGAARSRRRKLPLITRGDEIVQVLTASTAYCALTDWLVDGSPEKRLPPRASRKLVRCCVGMTCR